MFKLLDRIFKGFEWKLSLGTAFWSWLAPAGSFVLPAWAAEATGVFAEYAPLSWVVAGFVGLFAYSICVAMYGFGASRVVKSKYDTKFLIETGGVDPMSRVFEDKRIFLNDFVLPSSPVVDGKTFVNCEIVGPANVFLAAGNGIDEVKPGLVDAVALSGENPFYNGFNFSNCRFRGCTFHRVTLFFTAEEVSLNKDLNWLNWISPLPQQMNLPGTEAPTAIEDQSDQSPKESE